MSKDLYFSGPMFPSVIQGNGPDGLLPGGDMIFHSYAAWYIAVCGHKAILTIPEQVVMEGDVDLTVNLREVLLRLPSLYGLTTADDLEKIMNLMPLCRRVAFSKGMLWSQRFQAWLDSGGVAYNQVTREPDAI